MVGLICASLRDGEEWVREHPDVKVFLIPLRSSSRVRGLSLHTVTWTEMARADARFADTLDECMPSLLAQGGVVEAPWIGHH